jgi:Zn finger protein HypA/HybF involved in hydrogenase expression
VSGERFVRRCEQCGREDSSASWPSLDVARAEGELERVWQCPHCGSAAYRITVERAE